MNNDTTSDIVRLVGTVLWTVIRTILIIVTAIVVGGIRGASKVKMSSASQK